MADDDKAAKPGTPLPVEHPTAGGGSAQSEWTASDRRGPLGSADDDNVERFVPAHETDAEGGVDPATGPSAPISGGVPAHDALAFHGAPLPEADAMGQPDAEAPRPTGNATPPAAEPAGRKRSLIPVAAGLVGALVGAGSAWLVYSQSGSGEQIAALSSRVDALDRRPDPQPEIAKLRASLGDLQGKIAETPDSDPAGKIAALQAAVDELKTRASKPAPAQPAAPNPDKALAEKVSSLAEGVAESRKQATDAQSALDAMKSEQKQLGDKIAGLTVAVAGALKKADGAQSDVSSVQSAQKVLEGKLGSPALAVVADSLVQQIDAGQPYARQVEALAALAADPAKIAVLRENAAHGVPSAQALLAKWKPLADPVIATGSKAPANANFGERLEHGLFGLVSVRRADTTTGSDLASRVNLIEASLAHDDVPGAYATWQALPADAKAKSESWGALAKTSVEALAAARDLQHGAIDALGAKKP